MATTDGDRRRPPLFSVLSLNTNKRADLAGLPALLREGRPDFVFLQEVNVPADRLQAAVGGLGYTVHLSECDRPRRVMAVLTNHLNVSVTNIIPGLLQKVSYENLVIFHVYSPSNSSHHEKTVFFQQIADLVTQAKNSMPILIGDFNCVIDVKDIENDQGAHRINAFLRDYIKNSLFSDTYRVLHPATVRFSWYRRGFAAARLDRAYVQPLLEARVRTARYIPTTSDHHAFVLSLDLTGFGAAAAAARPAAKFYWKFNSSLLGEGDFLPAFQEMWRPVGEEAASYPAGPACWWEEKAKPAIGDFCRRFARLVAGRRAATRRFFTRALELAMEAGDWAKIDACREKLRGLDTIAAAGLAVRSGQPTADEEVPGLFHTAMEGRHGPTPGLTAVKTAGGQILREPEEVEQEILGFYNTLFQGRHSAAADRPDPFDTGRPFSPDRERAAAFLEGLPALTPEQSEQLEQPLRLEELEAAVAAAAAAKSPGLDGLSYELYKIIFPLVGAQLLAAFNGMLAARSLQPSLRQGVVRLLPKVRGVPAADQLRPITLLNTDYKLLTKILVNRLLPVLPDILQATQLCAVEGRSIFDGAAAVLSAAAFLQQHQLPGFLVSLDFYHAYDRICLQWVDMALKAMGFGETMRGWVAALHKGNTATFMLHKLSATIPVTFSFRQGDPLAQILFIIQEEPFLCRLQRSLHGLHFGGLREASLGYVDDVAALSSKEEDLVILDTVVSDYEAASGAILNRNQKSAILGLGSWAGRQEWPLAWLRSAEEIKLYGVYFTPNFEATQRVSWERTVGGLEATLRMWAARALPYLSQRRQILHVYALSKLWYLAQILPLPQLALRRILRAASDFVWRGRLERLAWAELTAPQRAGGLAVAEVATRARALLLKQACHRLASGGRPRAHISYWVGLKLLRFLPGLRVGPHAEVAPPQYVNLAVGLQEVLGLDWVRPGSLRGVTASALYKEFRGEPPEPKIMRRLPGQPWPRIWGRLALPGLPQALFEVGFSLIHNILPTGERRHRLRLAASPACDNCGAQTDSILHTFTACRRVAEAWEYLLFTASRLLGGPIRDADLLLLKFPICKNEIHIIYAVLAFAEMAWAARNGQADLAPITVKIKMSKAPAPFKSIFKL